MGLLTWLKGRYESEDPRLADWRRAWTTVAAAPDSAAVAALEGQLDALALPDDEVEIEREMLEAVRGLLDLRAELDASGLPVVSTGHRVIGTDTCHFSAPASMPDDEAQPAGRLLLTGARAVFVGGARTSAVPWHAVARVVQSERDIVVFRKDRESVHRFRCNTYTDAIRGVFVAQHLAARSQSGGAGSSAAMPSRGGA